jgi:energy-coupling factor transporter ATP-binding protein EcfA2
MNDEKKITLIFGKRGSGKSYLARYLVRSEKRLIVYDTLHEFSEGVVFEDRFEFLKFWRQVYRGNFRIIYRPTNPIAEFPALADLIFRLGDCTVYIEEIDSFMTPHTIGSEFCGLVQRGRHKRISLIGITQRPFGIHRLLTSQAKEIFIFNTNEPRDREYLRDLLGQEIEPMLDSLQQYEYLRWQDGQEKIIKTKAGAAGLCVCPDQGGGPAKA